jgi:hypothetical protein
MIARRATMSPSLGLTRKRKVSQVGGVPPRPGPGLSQDRVVVSDSETRTLAPPKRLKRSYAFYEPLTGSPSRRSNVTHGKNPFLSCKGQAAN